MYMSCTTPDKTLKKKEHWNPIHFIKLRGRYLLYILRASYQHSDMHLCQHSYEILSPEIYIDKKNRTGCPRYRAEKIHVLYFEKKGL